MTKKTPDIGADARAQIANILPAAIEKAVLHHEFFMDANQDAKTTKDYKDQVVAAKTGLAHIELLLKLAKMVDVVDENRAETIIDQIQNAQTELDNS